MALNPYLTQYFSRMTDPKFQQAQQQQNLFSALTKLGGGLMAAGAPTTQPGPVSYTNLTLPTNREV